MSGKGHVPGVIVGSRAGDGGNDGIAIGTATLGEGKLGQKQAYDESAKTDNQDFK